MSADGLGFTIDHVADHYLRYPGEVVTLHTRVQVTQSLPGYSLSIHLPPGLEIESYIPPAQREGMVPLVLYLEDGSRRVRWDVEDVLGPGVSHEYQVKARVELLPQPKVLSSTAIGVVFGDDSGARVQEKLAIDARTKAGYLHYLPALYEDDDFMSRFLMLFESFWNPIEGQVDRIWHYIDPAIAPADLLPWLASWLNLVLDERWPEEKRRKLIEAAVMLYRKRGTRQGLSDYLEIYTGVCPQIIEHRAQNFQLGMDTALGLGVALGKQNRPHTFTVSLNLPAIEAADPAEAQRLELARKRMIEEIIRTEKPAHAAYNLQIEIANRG